MKQPGRSVGSGTTDAGLPTPHLENNARGAQVVHENIFSTSMNCPIARSRPSNDPNFSLTVRALVAHFVSWPYFCLAINLYLIPSRTRRAEESSSAATVLN